MQKSLFFILIIIFYGTVSAASNDDILGMYSRYPNLRRRVTKEEGITKSTNNNRLLVDKPVNQVATVHAEGEITNTKELEKKENTIESTKKPPKKRPINFSRPFTGENRLDHSVTEYILQDYLNKNEDKNA